MNELLIDLKGWDIDIFSLPMPEREKPPFLNCYDQLFESNDGLYACLFYTIFQYRPGFSAGLTAIFENKDEPFMISNAANTWFEFNGFHSAIFGKNSNYLFLRKTCYNNRLSNPDIPFCIIDLEQRLFSFYEFDFTSTFYIINENDAGLFTLLLTQPYMLSSLGMQSRSGEIIDLNNCQWFDISILYNFCDLYWENI